MYHPFALTAHAYRSIAIQLWFVSVSILTLSFTFGSEKAVVLYTCYPHEAIMALKSKSEIFLFLFVKMMKYLL